MGVRGLAGSVPKSGHHTSDAVVPKPLGFAWSSPLQRAVLSLLEGRAGRKEIAPLHVTK